MSLALTLRFTRLSQDRLRFEYRRPDGSGEIVEMETEGVLVHDLLRYAVETGAGLKGSFFGILAKIGGYEELVVAGGAALGGEIAITERVVAALSVGLQQPDLDDAAFAAAVIEHLDIYEERAPRWLTPALIAAVRERMRQLTGDWEATRLGDTMELVFPPPYKT